MCHCVKIFKVGIIVGLFGPWHEKNCLRGSVDNKGGDQPAHPHSLITTFVIHLLERVITKLATSEIAISWVVAVAEQAGLSMTWSETPKTCLESRPI